jgi:hypothetical protein
MCKFGREEVDGRGENPTSKNWPPLFQWKGIPPLLYEVEIQAKGFYIGVCAGGFSTFLR